jgi:acyl-CoA reductase-like NAD-dependent aldehyde dehydrogenase
MLKPSGQGRGPRSPRAPEREDVLARATPSAALLIDDRHVAAAKEATFDRLDPVARVVATRAAAASVADATHAANVAARAFPVWSATPPTERRAALNRAADLLLERETDLADAITAETGGTRGWAAFNCRLAASILREAASMTTQISGEVIPSDNSGTLALAMRQAAGVVFSMAPWNAPVILAVRSVAVPLACGNTVVLKGSELSPRTHSIVAEVLSSCGMPNGTLNFINTDPEMAPEIVEALIAHPAVRRVNFTGSTRVGRIIAETAARYLKPALLELGGKAPLLVLDDADLDAAVDAAVFGAFFHQGQICMSTERIVVDEKVADSFLQKFVARAKDIHAADPRKDGTKLGAMITEQAAQRVRAMIDDAVQKGATLALAGHQQGVFVDPTILDRVGPGMRVYYDECFGPLASIIRVSGDDEAITVANDTEYGLAAAVFSRDVSRALAVARRLETGICHINGPTIQDEPQMPFGGVKASGYGRFGGRAGIEAFTELRWITIAGDKHSYPL